MKSATVSLVWALAAAVATGPTAPAEAASDITTAPLIADAQHAVPACTTPGRLAAFVKARNANPTHAADEIAVAYMQHGERLGIRWDLVFYQMLVETGDLSFRDGLRARRVKAEQNNFAGIGALGGNDSGESFESIADGARAHLEHVALYAGVSVPEPIAERTRKVQEWRILERWMKRLGRPVTVADFARQWAPSDRRYGNTVASLAQAFAEGPCKAADPAPELVARARAPDERAKAVATTENGRGSGVEIAKRAIEEERASGGTRSALGAGASASASAGLPFKLLNPLREETPPAAATAGTPAAPPTVNPPPTRTASAASGAASAIAKGAIGDLAKGVDPAKCRVWTASYGGSKGLIIKVSSEQGVHLTVLDVNEGQERREADAFIAAYAKGGQIAGEFATQAQALEKAFEICPEG
jgi:hypothetical protein